MEILNSAGMGVVNRTWIELSHGQFSLHLRFTKMTKEKQMRCWGKDLGKIGVRWNAWSLWKKGIRRLIAGGVCEYSFCVMTRIYYAT